MTIQPSQLVGFSDVGRVLLRWSPLIILCALLGAAVPALSLEEDDGYVAVARVGLTDQVRWPFYGSVRQRVQAIGEQTEPSTIWAQVDGGAAIVAVDLGLPEDEAWLEVEVTASTQAAAIAGADAFAAYLVVAEGELYVQEALDELDVIDRQLAELDASLVDVGERIDALVIIEGENEVAYQASFQTGVPDTEALTTLRAAQDDLSAARQERDAFLRRQTNISVDQDELARQASGELNDVALLRPAVSEPVPVQRGTLAILLAGFTGAIAGALLAWLLDARYGKLSSRSAVEAATGLPVVEARTAHEWQSAVLRLLPDPDCKRMVLGFVGADRPVDGAIRALEAEGGGGESAAVASIEKAAVERYEGSMFEAERELVQAVDRLGLERRAVLVDLGEPGGSVWFDLALPVCQDIVVVVELGTTRGRHVRRQLEELGARGVEVSTILAVGTTPDRPPAAVTTPS